MENFFSYGLQKKDKLMLFNHFKAFSINLNAQHVNGMTHFGFVEINERLLNALK